MKNILKDKKGIFGLNAVQTFFTIILGIALLAYVIIIVMGVLGDSSIVTKNTLSGSIINETVLGFNYSVGDALSASTLDGVLCTVTGVKNQSTGISVGTGNWTTSNCQLFSANSAEVINANVKVDYSYTYNMPQIGDSRKILSNTSSGITSFFTSINPVYAILAILVIILILVVLVRVVQGGKEGTVQM